MNQLSNSAVSITASLLVAAQLTGCGQKSEPEVEPVKEAGSEIDTATIAPPRTSSPHGARVFFISPADGATVSNPVKIEFGIDLMTVVKAGDAQPDSGHHHLLIDTGLPDLNLPIPADSQHIHFGDGSTTTEITLPSGEHKLQMLLGDHLHVPHDPRVVSKSITITVE